MKVIVKTAFADGLNYRIVHQPGEVLEWEDAERVNAAVESGLVECTEAEAKPAPKKKVTKKA